MTTSDFAELAFLARSETRMAILESLVDQPRDLRGLSDDLEVPRTTLNDNLVKLDERGWIERATGDYRVTMLGRTVHRVAATCRRSMRTVQKLSPFLESVSELDHELEVSRFHDSTVVNAEFPEPYAPVEHLRRRIETASTVRGVVSVVLPGFGELLGERVLAGDSEVELVVDDRLLEALSDRFGDRFETGLELGQVRVGVHDDVAFEVLLVDDALLLVSTNDDGFVESVVVADSRDAYEWGDDVYRSYRGDVERFLP